MVVCDVEVCLVDDCQGVWAVDLGVRDGFEVGCGVFLGIDAEDFEAGAGLGVVYYVEGAAWVVVFDSERVQVGVGGGEVEEFDGGGFGVWGGVVVDVEVALGLGMVEDALCWFVSEVACWDQHQNDVVEDECFRRKNTRVYNRDVCLYA